MGTGSTDALLQAIQDGLCPNTSNGISHLPLHTFVPDPSVLPVCSNLQTPLSSLFIPNSNSSLRIPSRRQRLRRPPLVLCEMVRAPGQGHLEGVSRVSTSRPSSHSPRRQHIHSPREHIAWLDDRHGMRTPADSAPRPAPPISHKQQQMYDSWRHDTLTPPRDNPRSKAWFSCPPPDWNIPPPSRHVLPSPRSSRHHPPRTSGGTDILFRISKLFIRLSCIAFACGNAILTCESNTGLS